MKVFSDAFTYRGDNPVVTIGMFDGVHQGHRKLLKHLVDKAKEVNGHAVVVTFWPHPRQVLKKNADNLKFITTQEEKTRMISEQGVDHFVILRFNLDLASLKAEEFIQTILIDKIKMKHLVVGYNHRFGSDMIHDYSFYQQLGKKHGFGVSRVEAVTINERKVSSTVVRNLLVDGKVEDANVILGYHFSILGTVIGGNKIGRTIGFPTANIHPNEKNQLIPANGVYACKIKVMGKTYEGMLNIGLRPTIGGESEEPTIEVHIFDFKKEIYSEEIEVLFVKKIRDEKKFSSLDELMEQLRYDKEIVKNIFN